MDIQQVNVQVRKKHKSLKSFQHFLQLLTKKTDGKNETHHKPSENRNFPSFLITFEKNHRHWQKKNSPDIVVALNVDLVELRLPRLPGNVILHLHGHMTWQHRQKQLLLLLILPLDFQTGLDTLPRLQERLALGLLARPMQQHAHHSCAHEGHHRTAQLGKEVSLKMPSSSMYTHFVHIIIINLERHAKDEDDENREKNGIIYHLPIYLLVQDDG
jgi:hypothetical protein